MVGGDRRAELGHRAQVVGPERDHVRHRVDDHADDARADVEHDDDGEGVVVRLRLVELQPHVDDRHDHAAQVDHALDELGRVGDARRFLVGADLLHAQDVDAVLLGAEAEGEELPAGMGLGAGRLVLGHVLGVGDHVHGSSLCLATSDLSDRHIGSPPNVCRVVRPRRARRGGIPSPPGPAGQPAT